MSTQKNQTAEIAALKQQLSTAQKQLQKARESNEKLADAITSTELSLALSQQSADQLINENQALIDHIANTENCFGVIAGKYEGPASEQNIKIAHNDLTIDAAIAAYAEVENYPFSYITYKEISFIALKSIAEQAA
jgi:DNA repair exonuclease SbcCD ATPase subunit